MALAAFENNQVNETDVDVWDSQIERKAVENGALSNDKIELMLAQERKLTILETMNRNLVAERNQLRQQCRAQAAKIQSLESGEYEKSPDRQQQIIAIDDLPMFDPAEFLPVEDQPEKETTMQRLVSLVKK